MPDCARMKHHTVTADATEAQNTEEYKQQYEKEEYNQLRKEETKIHQKRTTETK